EVIPGSRRRSSECATDDPPRLHDGPLDGGLAPELRRERRGEAAARSPVLRAASQSAGAESARPPPPSAAAPPRPPPPKPPPPPPAFDPRPPHPRPRPTCPAAVLEPTNPQQPRRLDRVRREPDVGSGELEVVPPAQARQPPAGRGAHDRINDPGHVRPPQG